MVDYLSRYKVIVFDLGGTLMEYSGMPLNWSEYYFKGFKTVSENHNLFLSDNEIQISSEILKAVLMKKRNISWKISTLTKSNIAKTVGRDTHVPVNVFP